MLTLLVQHYLKIGLPHVKSDVVRMNDQRQLQLTPLLQAKERVYIGGKVFIHVPIIWTHSFTSIRFIN